jgi:hypothetical protein
MPTAILAINASIASTSAFSSSYNQPTNQPTNQPKCTVLLSVACCVWQCSGLCSRIPFWNPLDSRQFSVALQSMTAHQRTLGHEFLGRAMKIHLLCRSSAYQHDATTANQAANILLTGLKSKLRSVIANYTIGYQAEPQHIRSVNRRFKVCSSPIARTSMSNGVICSRRINKCRIKNNWPSAKPSLLWIAADARRSEWQHSDTASCARPSKIEDCPSRSHVNQRASGSACIGTTPKPIHTSMQR